MNEHYSFNSYGGADEGWFNVKNVIGLVLVVCAVVVLAKMGNESFLNTAEYRRAGQQYHSLGERSVHNKTFSGHQDHHPSFLGRGFVSNFAGNVSKPDSSFATYERNPLSAAGERTPDMKVYTGFTDNHPVNEAVGPVAGVSHFNGNVGKKEGYAIPMNGPNWKFTSLANNECMAYRDGVTAPNSCAPDSASVHEVTKGFDYTHAKRINANSVSWQDFINPNYVKANINEDNRRKVLADKHVEEAKKNLLRANSI